jgi:hypothetical protein
MYQDTKKPPTLEEIEAMSSAELRRLAGSMGVSIKRNSRVILSLSILNPPSSSLTDFLDEGHSCSPPRHEEHV